MKTWKKWGIAYGSVVLFAFFPLLLVLIASALAPLFGCDASNINEGSAPECPGGEILYLLFVSGWLSLATLPIGAIVLGLLLLIHTGLFLRKKMNQKKTISEA